MGAEIAWPAGRVGVLRFGPCFHSSDARDRYEGCGTVEDHGEWCLIGPIAGRFGADDWDDILDACERSGFLRAVFERRGRRFSVDLTQRPFRMVRV